MEHERVVRVLYLVATIIIFVMWVWSADSPTTAINSDPRSKLSELIYGTAHKPYVQRVLVPVLTRTIYGVLPQEFWRNVTEPVRLLPKTQKEIERLGWEENFFAEYLIAYGIAFTFFLPFPFIARKLWRLINPSDQFYTNTAGLAALIVLPTVFHTGPHYIYDLPALTLFTAGLVLLLQRRWLWYYVIFVAGCLNKETMLLMLWAFLALYRKRANDTNIFKHIAGHVILFAAAKVLLMITFADNPGPGLEFHLYGNLHELLLGYTWTGLLVTGFTAYLILHDLPGKPRDLRALSTLVIPFGFLILIFGVVYELRAAYEILPVLTFTMLCTIQKHLAQTGRGIQP